MTTPNPMHARDLSNRDHLRFSIGNRTSFLAWEGADGRWYGHQTVSGRVKNDFSYASRRSMRRAIKVAIRAQYPGIEFVR